MISIPDKSSVKTKYVSSKQLNSKALCLQVRCLACGTESKKFDPFLDLSLELPETGRHDAPVSLADCLASFVQVTHFILIILVY